MSRTTIAALLLLSAGCYHASVETGMKAGNDKIEKEWASGFAWGLVGPDPIEAQSKCTSGVSKVETEHSFLNSLVQVVTLGIYTPMHLTVTCGSGATADVPPPASSPAPGVASSH
jgi:hypothetical protein